MTDIEGTKATTTPAAADNFDISQREDVQKLHKHAVGLWGVLFLTLTGAAPISAMLFNTPIMVGYGEGRYAPSAFVFAGVVLVIFAVGYVAMARKKTTAGGFYSFISYGLGREIGMGMGFASVVAYSVFEASLCGGFAFFANAKLASFGINIAWPWLALFMIILISLLTYFDIRLSTIIFGIGLVAEFIILMLFDVFLFAKGHVSMSAINPLEVLKGFPAHGALVAGAAGIGVFFAFWCFVGFEMAPNYGEESRDPKRIVPRALYISVIGLAIFYTLTSWAPLAGYSSTHAAVTAAQTNAANFYFVPATKYAGKWMASILSYLIITGSFACGMAFHNTTARYLYSLGREGLLPKPLGKTHHRWHSPHVASITQSVIAALIVGGFALFVGSNDPSTQAYLQLYGLMAIMGVIVILVAQALVSASVIFYYERHEKDETHWWRTRLAPFLAFITQGYVIYLLFKNLLFLGSGYKYAEWFGPIDLLFLLIGVAGAFYLKARKRAKYDQIGRLINEGL
jgi:amino acid transporter